MLNTNLKNLFKWNDKMPKIWHFSRSKWQRFPWECPSGFTGGTWLTPGLRWLNAASVYCFPPALHKHALSAGTLHSICRFRSVSLKGQQSRDWCLENKLRRRWMQSKAPHVYWWPPFRVSLSSIFHSPREGHCSETEFRAGTFERIRSGLSCKTRRQHYIYTHKKFFLSI